VTAQLDRMQTFLKNLGVAWLPHAGQSYLEHLTAVYNGLKLWGQDSDVCNAGFFHSIYGTERFSAFKLPLSSRVTVKGIIGDRAESIAYLNCTMNREEFDAFVLEHQEGRLKKPRDRALYAVHLCDWLDQVPFNREWGYRRIIYETIAQELAGQALSAFEWVYRGR
jgi:hypothetical protein